MVKGTGLTAIFQTRVKELRKARSLTQTALAKKAGLTGQFVSLLEKGERNVSLEVVEALAKALDVPAISLLETADKPEKLPSRAKAVRIAINILKKYEK